MEDQLYISTSEIFFFNPGPGRHNPLGVFYRQVENPGEKLYNELNFFTRSTKNSVE